MHPGHSLLHCTSVHSCQRRKEPPLHTHRRHTLPHLLTASPTCLKPCSAFAASHCGRLCWSAVARLLSCSSQSPEAGAGANLGVEGLESPCRPGLNSLAPMSPPYGSGVDYLNSVLSQGGPQAVPYDEAVKWNVRDHVLELQKVWRPHVSCSHVMSRSLHNGDGGPSGCCRPAPRSTPQIFPTLSVKLSDYMTNDGRWGSRAWADGAKPPCPIVGDPVPVYSRPCFEHERTRGVQAAQRPQSGRHHSHPLPGASAHAWDGQVHTGGRGWRRGQPP